MHMSITRFPKNTASDLLLAARGTWNFGHAFRSAHEQVMGLEGVERWESRYDANPMMNVERLDTGARQARGSFISTFPTRCDPFGTLNGILLPRAWAMELFAMMRSNI